MFKGHNKKTKKRATVNNKDTRRTSGASVVNFQHIPLSILQLLLLYCWIRTNKCWLSLRNGSFIQKIVFSNIEKYYIVLWAWRICWAICFYLYSPTLSLRKNTFSRQHFKKDKSNPVVGVAIHDFKNSWPG